MNGVAKAEFVESAGVRSIVRPDFALTFEQLGDRWTHSIAVPRNPGDPRELIARAVEWDAGRDDPDRVVSPVFQELQFQVDGKGRPQALLLGMSGKHHFSAVFTLEDARLDVEVADRCRKDVLGLASTYTVMLHSGELASCNESSIAWDLGSNPLAFSGSGSTRVAMAEAGRRATRVQATVDAAIAEPTRRWQYSWNFATPR